MRLIDADALLKTVPFTRRGGDLTEYTEGYIDCSVDARVAIDDAPTVDAEPVVRCKDCEHSYEDIVYVGGVATCGRCCSYGTCCDIPVDDDFFCRDGKRKEDEQ